jgi:low temperature requirement protein LtrA
VSDAERELEHGDEHQVTPLELFFDLTFVFAVTQVTILLADDPTWGGVFRGMLVLAALWWAWSVYAWLTSAMDVDEGGVRLAMLASMGAMLVVALAVRRARSETTPCCSVSPTSSSASFISSSQPPSFATIPTAGARFSDSRRRRS